MTEERGTHSGIWYVLKILEVSGYLAIGLAISTLACGLALWATGNIPESSDPEAVWHGQMTTVLGYALGYGFVTTIIALPVWLVGCSVRGLRWLRAWKLALLLANGLMITAIIVAFLRAA